MTVKCTPLIIIPARIGATRLPRKPLADIAGKPMIRHVWERAVAGGLAPVWVASDDAEVCQVIKAAGGNAVMTSRDHPSGSDRCHEAVAAIDPDGRHDMVLNLQGDIPEMDEDVPSRLLDAAMLDGAELSTLVARADAHEAELPQVVKAVVSWHGEAEGGGRTGRAHYFSRAVVPSGEGETYHHVGVYAWRRDALARFVGLAPSPLEIRERLEQLRAIEAGMTVAVAEIDRAPPGIDTADDLEAVRRRLG